MYEAIIFDMDGTLVDSEVVWDVAEKEMFAERGLVYDAAVREQVIGLRLDEFFDKLIKIYDLDEKREDLQAELIERMLVKIPADVEAKAGAQALIEWTAQQENLPYCIASSSPMVIIEATVKAQGWEQLIPKLYTADNVPNGKPAPDVYLYAAEQLGVAPDKCLALEDSPNGARSAVAAGMTCFAIPDSHSSPEKFEGITSHVYENLVDVLAVLKEDADS
ncbi:MAG: HAD family phosphatase [Chloroflexota bacterium]